MRFARSFYAVIFCLVALQSGAHTRVIALGADTTTGSEWRDPSVIKPNDPDGDHVYGTDGFLLLEWKHPHWNWSPRDRANDYRVLPDYIASISDDYINAYGDDNYYGQMNHPFGSHYHFGRVASGKQWGFNQITIERNGTTGPFAVTFISTYDKFTHQIFAHVGDEIQNATQVTFNSVPNQVRYATFLIPAGSQPVILREYSQANHCSGIAFDGLSPFPLESLAVWFDASQVTWDESCLLQAMQGIVNRQGPRLFMNFPSWDWSLDSQWMDIYGERNRIFLRDDLQDLHSLLNHFQDSIKGVVVYDPLLDGTRYAALTLAGLEDLLPVSPGILQGYAAGLRVQSTWDGIDFSTATPEQVHGTWIASYPYSVWSARNELMPGQGLRMRNHLVKGDAITQNIVDYGPFQVDLDHYPILEVDVAEVTGGRWEVQIALDPNRDGNLHWYWLTTTGASGIRRWNLAERTGQSGFLQVRLLRLVVRDSGAQALWRRIRFLSTEGIPAPQNPPIPLTQSHALELIHDLRNQFDNTLSVYDWALEHLMPRVNRSYAHTVGALVDGRQFGGGPNDGVDFIILKKGFIFNLTFNDTATHAFGVDYEGDPAYAARYHSILAALDQPAFIMGYGDSENDWFPLLNRYGHHYIYNGYRNCSFHHQVPPLRPILQQPFHFDPETVQVDEDKFYVCFTNSESDTLKGVITQHYQSWNRDPKRGTIPFSFAVPPQMGRYFPAMLEYYFDTATENDYFIGGSVYNFNTEDPEKERRLFERVASDLRLSDFSCVAPVPMIPMPQAKHELFARILQPLGIGEIIWSGSQYGIQTLLPDGTPRATNAAWCGYTERILNQGHWGGPNLGDYYADQATWSQSVQEIVQYLEGIAANQSPPFVIIFFSNLFNSLNAPNQYSLHADIAAALDPSRFKIARMDEAMAALRRYYNRTFYDVDSNLINHFSRIEDIQRCFIQNPSDGTPLYIEQSEPRPGFPNPGRSGILKVHPRDTDTPCLVYRRVTLPDLSRIILRISASADPYGDPNLADFLLQAGLEDQEGAMHWFEERVITAGDVPTEQNWYDLEYDLSEFRGQTVRLIVRISAGGTQHSWWNEWAYLDEFSVYADESMVSHWLAY